MTTLSNANEIDDLLSFGEWLKRRRRELDLTRAELAARASCSVFALRKIENGERRPSKQLAELIAQALDIPSGERATFIKVARGELDLERLHSPAQAPSHLSQPAARPSPIPENLPRALTPFIGREPELVALGQLLQDPQCSLLTIVGSGGIGKTRLAIEAAQHARNLFPDGIWFVPLATLNSPVLLVQSIAGALGFKFQDPTNPQAQLIRYLRDKKALLILDNAEHLLEGVEVFTEILEGCPQVKLLVTSRERLNLLSEWVFEVLGLPVPPDDQVEQFEAYSAVALFLQSARRVQAAFDLQNCNRHWVLKICQIMEGMPLGIELSAAWVGMFSCEEIAQEIERNIDFLAVSMRDLPPRHRSLRATLDYSWNLLSAEEKLILSRLAVFRGSFRREEAQEICEADLLTLSSLRDKMLLYRTNGEYYALHEIIRQYAEIKLSEDPHEDEQVRDRHAAYYVRCLSEGEKEIKSSRQTEIFDEMAREIDNFSQAWLRMVASFQPETLNKPIHPDVFRRALFSLSLFYEMRCRSWEAIALLTESLDHLKTVQDALEKTEDRSIFTSILGHLTAYLGLHHSYILQFKQSRYYLEEAIQLLENRQSRVERAQAQVILSAIDYRQGYLQRSIDLLEQSQDVFKEAGEDWWYILSLINLARSYLPIGKLEECESLYQEAARLVKPGDLRLEIPLRRCFADICYLKGDFAKAEQLMQANLQLSHQYKNDRYIAYDCVDLGLVALATDRVELAEKYFLESAHLLSEFGESHDLAIDLLYLGKCLAARMDLKSAREKFRQVIKIGRTLDTFYLVYWGLVNLARIDLIAGQPEKALELSLLLSRCPMERKDAQEEGNRLLADLQARLPASQIETGLQQVESKLPADQVASEVLAYAMRLESE